MCNPALERNPHFFRMRDSDSRQHTPPATVAALLAEAEAVLVAQGVDTPRLDAEALLAHSLTIDRSHLFARLSVSLSQSEQDAFRRSVERRARREPLAYITGVREFWSLAFHVTPAVLVPRPETEVVVETILRLLSRSASQDTNTSVKKQIPDSGLVSRETVGATPCGRPEMGRHGGLPLQRRTVESKLTHCRILDIGAGSGCIAIALAKELSDAELWAVDTSPEALAVARDNAQRHGVMERLHFRQGDLFGPVKDNKELFDVIVSNPPYITRRDFPVLQAEVRDWEPRAALDGGEDGLDFYRRLVEEGPRYLRPGGWLVMELGAGQWPAVLRLFQAQRNLTGGFRVYDYAGHERVAVASRASSHIN